VANLHSALNEARRIDANSRLPAIVMRRLDRIGAALPMNGADR